MAMAIDFTEGALYVNALLDRLTELAEAELTEHLEEFEELELERLREVIDDIGTCAGDMLIRDEEFEDHVRGLCYHTGDIGRASWLDVFVDWTKAAEAAKADYRAIRIEDESGDEFATYWIRS